jgi:hypothetical protein
MREREKENRSVEIKLTKRVYLCGLLVKHATNVAVVHVCLSDLQLGYQIWTLRMKRAYLIELLVGTYALSRICKE